MLIDVTKTQFGCRATFGDVIAKRYDLIIYTLYGKHNVRLPLRNGCELMSHDKGFLQVKSMVQTLRKTL